MKELKQRLKTVQELLNLAVFIRTKGETIAADEALKAERWLQHRKAELEMEIARQPRAIKPAKDSQQLALSH